MKRAARNVHETLHARRRLGECILQTSDGGENLAESDQYIPRCLYSNVDIIGTIFTRHGVTGRPNVDFMLEDGGESHRQRGQGKADGDTGHGVHGEAHPTKEGVDELVEDGDEDDDDDGVDVLHLVVGHAVQLHAARLAHKVRAELIVAGGVFMLADAHNHEIHEKLT